MVASLASLGPTLLTAPCRGGVAQYSAHFWPLSVLKPLLGTPHPGSIHGAGRSGDHKSGEQGLVALGRHGAMDKVTSPGQPLVLRDCPLPQDAVTPSSARPSEASFLDKPALGRPVSNCHGNWLAFQLD